MFRNSTLKLAGYVVQARLVPDWWHPFPREDVGAVSRDRLEVIQSAVDTVEDTVEKSSRKSDSLTLYECNALVGTFTSQHNASDIGLVLHYIRTTLDQELTPYHMHSLFRVFNHQQDKDNAVQLMEVIASRGDSTLETYARVVDYFHCTAPEDGLTRMLRVVELAQDAFGGQVFHPSQGSELATVAAYGTGPEHEEAVADPDSSPGSLEDTHRRSAPVLSSLLHHVSTSLSTPLGAVMVAVWIRALRIDLSDWDYVSLCSAVIGHAELFPHLRQTTEMLSAFPRGVVTLDALLRRVRQLGWCRRPEDPISRLVEAMETSLKAAGVDFTARLELGVVNTQSTQVEYYIDRLLQEAERRSGLGCYQFNTALLHHTLTLLYSSMGNNTQALRVLLRAVAGEEEWQRTYGEGKATSSSSSGSVPSESTVGEPFKIPFYHLIDAGQLLPQVSSRTLREIREAYLLLTKQVEVEANEYLLVSSTTPLASVGQVAKLPTLAAPPSRPTAVDAISCSSFNTLFFRTAEEASEALQRAVASVDPQRPKLLRTTRQLLKQLAQLCCLHPPRNPKFSQRGYEERRKWGSYLEARDTALALFGSAQHARDAMKEMFYNDNQLQPLRSPDVVERDCSEVAKIFFPEQFSNSRNSHNSNPKEEATEEQAVLPPWKRMERWHGQRTTLPHLRCPSTVVPRYLWDTSLPNPYPHLHLRRSPLEEDPFLDIADPPVDLFPALWEVIQNPHLMGPDKWYVQNSDMYLLLMKALLYRLDWESAVRLTTQMLQHSNYTFLMDHELTMIFREIGDPTGCLAFKVAAKLFDGRITRDGQTRREQYHQDQFQ